MVLATVLHVPPAAAVTLQSPRFTREQMEAALAGARAFRFVYGTRDPAFTAMLRAQALALAVRAFAGDSSQVVADRDANDTLIAAGPIYLLGGPDENAVTRRLAPALPVRFEAGSFRWQGQLYDHPRDAIHLSWPNPLSPSRFLLLSAGNSPGAIAGGFALSDDDWRIVRDGVVVRSGRFAQDAAHPWSYDPRRDRDREGERDRYERTLVVTGGAGLAVHAPAGLALAAEVSGRAEALLARMARQGFAAPAGAARPTLTLYRSLEEKGTLTFDTHAEHTVGPARDDRANVSPAAHAALPAGRSTLDLWSVPALRFLQCGASPSSRFLAPAAVAWANRFEGEPIERSLSRLYFAGLLPRAVEAASRGGAWRSPLVWVPARSLLARAVWEVARPASAREALLSLLRADPPGTLDSLCAVAHVSASAVGQRYRALADSIARIGRRRDAARHLDAWRPAQGFQRGVCVAHEEGVDRGYLSAACARELTRIRDAGADWVALTPFASLADPRSPVLGNSTDAGPDGESDEAVCEAAARAHALGLRVWLKPQVWTRGWEGALAFRPSGWRQFFDGYDDILLHWAILADREGLDGLFVGHELASSTAADPGRWREMIGSVRRVYSGTLAYDANWDEVARVPFWDALDLIGVSFYTPLSDRPTHDPGQLQAGAMKALAALHEVARKTGRAVLIAELGYPPTATAAERPWDGTTAAADPDLQRLCLEAAIAAMDPQEWIAGAFFWRWGSGPRGRDDPFDPRGMPAEDVIARALKDWKDRPVRLPAPPAAAKSR